MRNLRYPFGREPGAQAQAQMELRSKRRRVRELLARRESEWRLLSLAALVAGLAAIAILLG